MPNQLQNPGHRAAGPLGILGDESVRLCLVGGKGGVGKTTTAAAVAIHLARRFPQRRYLAVSTGPSHSLADILGVPLDSTPEPVPETGNLWGLEMDAVGLLRGFKARHNKALRMILGRGTYLDDEDISRFLDLSFPGVDELMALIELINLTESGGYDSIIVDTAPTGHTLRLLSLPALTAGWVSMLDRMLEKHRFMSRVYTQRYRKDEADEFIEKLNQDLSRIAAVLCDRRRCRFVVVTLPEPVVIAETERLLDALTQRGVAVACLLVNRLLQPADGCPLCRSLAAAQRAVLDQLTDRRQDLPVAVLPEYLEEIRGAPALVGFLEGQIEDTRNGPRGDSLVWLPSARPGALPMPGPGQEFFLFCGKGGVGKSTLASAFALQLSRAYPERRVLLFSTDPAHSLSDCLAQKVGAEDTEVAGTGNLFAREIDPEILFARWKQAYSRSIEEAFEKFSSRSGLDIRFDREVIAGLLDLTPPSLDELVCLTELAEMADRKAYDFYVLDTAPGGHTLRFLELPVVIRDWLRTIFGILLKYRQVARLPEASEALIEVSRRVKKIQQIFSDPVRSEAMTVVVPTRAAREETGRMVSALGRAGVRTRRLLVNRVIGVTGNCPRCGLAARQQAVEMQQLHDSFGELDMVAFPHLGGEVRGTEGLSRLLSFAPARELSPVEVAQ